jgi:hypothetical protein
MKILRERSRPADQTFEFEEDEENVKILPKAG